MTDPLNNHIVNYFDSLFNDMKVPYSITAGINDFNDRYFAFGFERPYFNGTVSTLMLDYLVNKLQNKYNDIAHNIFIINRYEIVFILKSKIEIRKFRIAKLLENG